ncbi:MAG: FAD-dependent oxidoreductase [Nitrososphaeraceae archaeon]
MYDIIIIGGASAGFAAAIYASRQGMKTLILTKDIGGHAILTPVIENYPSFERIGESPNFCVCSFLSISKSLLYIKI